MFILDFFGLLFAIVVLFVLPLGLGGLAIWLPLRIYFRRGSVTALVVGIINGAFCGLSMLALLATVVFQGYPTFPPYFVIAAGTMAMIAVVALTKNQRPKQRIVVNGPPGTSSS